MTEKQIEKSQWLSRLYYVKLRMKSLYSIKEADKINAETTKMIKIENDETAGKCKAILEHISAKSEENT